MPNLKKFKVSTTTGAGFPSDLKELRSGSSLEVSMDRVAQALFRTTCHDGFQAGFEAGLRAARTTPRTKSEGLGQVLAEKVAEHLSSLGQELKDCNEVHLL